MNITKLISLETQVSLAKDIELEHDRREEERSRSVTVNGIEFDIEDTDLSGGETTMILAYPLHDTGAGKTYKLVEVK